MTDDRYITITVAYDTLSSYGRSLEWIAPELTDADLTMVEDRADDPRPSRTWAGTVDEPTFKRFADAWHLDHHGDEASEATLTGDGPAVRGTYTFDGMNWEAGGESPIVYVSVHVGVTAAAC